MILIKIDIYIYIILLFFCAGARDVRMSHKMTRSDYSRLAFASLTPKECDTCRMTRIPVWEVSGAFVAERLKSGRWTTTEDLREWGHAYVGMAAHVTYGVEDGDALIGWAFAHGNVGLILEEFYRVQGNETCYSKVFNINQEAKCKTPYTDFVRKELQTIPDEDDDDDDDGNDDVDAIVICENLECPCIQEAAQRASSQEAAQLASSQHAVDSDDSDGSDEGDLASFD